MVASRAAIRLIPHHDREPAAEPHRAHHDGIGRQGGLMVQLSRLPHASAACGVPALMGIDTLRRHGVQPALLNAIATAHRGATNQAIRPMSGTRRGLVKRAALGLLLPILWSSVATAQDPATMPLGTMMAEAPSLPPVSLYMLAGRLFAAGRRDDAVVWFYIAQIRARFRLAVAPSLAPDGEPAVYEALFETIGPQINGLGVRRYRSCGGAHAGSARLGQLACQRRSRPRPGHEAELEQVRSGLMSLRASVLTRKDELRTGAHRQWPSQQISFVPSCPWSPPVSHGSRLAAPGWGRSARSPLGVAPRREPGADRHPGAGLAGTSVPLRAELAWSIDADLSRDDRG